MLQDSPRFIKLVGLRRSFVRQLRGNIDFLSSAMLVLGVFIGSVAGWWLLSGGVGLLRARFDLNAMRWVNRISGIIILVFGLVILANLR